MKEQELENIFKDAFENFEAPVDASVWSGVEQGLDAAGQSAAGASGAAASKGGSMLSGLGGSIGLGVVGVGIVAMSVFYISRDSAEQVPVVEEKIEQVQSEDEISIAATDESEIVNAASEITETTNENIEQVGQTKNVSTPPTSDLQNDIASEIDVQDSNIETPVAESSESTEETSSKQHSNQAEPELNMPAPEVALEKEIKDVIEAHEKEPLAYIDANPVSGVAPLVVNFNNVGYAKEHRWDFGDGVIIQSGNAVVHEFTQPGIYEVVLEAGNIIGTDVNTITIEVREPKTEPTMESTLGGIPNVFTPNGDGKNDEFVVNHENLDNLDISIFDKRGKVVYKWKQIDDSWDGRTNGGAESPSGTYFFILKAVGKDGKGYEHRGSLTLFR